MASVLREVELKAPADRIVKSFSGGQQVRATLAPCVLWVCGVRGVCDVCV